MSFVNSVLFNTDTSGNENLTFSVGAGSNRVLRIICCYEQTNNSRAVTLVTVGGVSATKKGGIVHGAGSTWAYVEEWYILEAAIGGVGANPTLAITPASGASGFVCGVIITDDGRDQTAANWTTQSDGDTAANALSASLTSANGADVAGGMTCTVTGFSFTTDSPLTEFASSDRNQASGLAFRNVQFYYASTGTPVAIGGDNGSTSGSAYQAIYAVSIPAAATDPTITATDPDPAIVGSSLTITGTNFESSQGTGGATLDGAGQTETAWSDTSITFTVALGNNRYGTQALVVTNNSGNSSSATNINVQPESTKSYINLSGALATSGARITAVPDLQNTYQLEISGVVGGTIDQVQVFADASIAWTGAVTGFYVRAHDGSTWGALGFQSISNFTAALVNKLSIGIGIRI